MLERLLLNEILMALSEILVTTPHWGLQHGSAIVHIAQSTRFSVDP